MTTKLNSIKMGDHLLTLEETGEVGDFFIDKAFRELRETEDLRNDALRELKMKLSNTENLQIDITNEKFLLSNLRSCKFYVDSAYDKILKSLNFKVKNPKYFCNLSPESDKIPLVNNLFTVLPYRDVHGRRIVVLEIGSKWDPKVISLEQIFRSLVILIEAATLETKTQISGVNLILDMEGLTMSHAWHFSPVIAKLLLTYVQDHLPLRLKSVHIVNQPYVFNMVYAIFKPFILEKLSKRIFFHGSDMSILIEHIDPKFLPTQYGGVLELESVFGKELQYLLCEHIDKFDAYNARSYKKPKK